METERQKGTNLTEQNSSGEISLWDMGYKICMLAGRFFSTVWGLLKWCVRTTLRVGVRNRWLFASLIGIGITIAVLQCMISPKTYSVGTLIESRILNNLQETSNEVTRINALNTYIQQKEYRTLANMLNINVDECKQWQEIDADVRIVQGEKRRVTIKLMENGIEREEIEESVISEAHQYIRIGLIITDTIGISGWDTIFCAFIDANPYAREQIQRARRENLEIKSNIEAQIIQLQEFQRKNIDQAKTTTVTPDQSFPFVLQKTEQTYVDEILSLQNNVVALKTQFEQMKTEIVRYFSGNVKENNRLLRYVGLYCSLLVIAGCAYIFVKTYYRRWREIIEEEEEVVV
ncbi:hypothetical protein FACS1894201_06150 [Bacteroidia bacterium]|nr:hypothetical protein FACS1894201_06150 [Bacteroidia bacterium]